MEEVNALTPRLATNVTVTQVSDWEVIKNARVSISNNFGTDADLF